MSATASWARRYWLELLWVLFCAANLAVVLKLAEFQTVPFHFIWVSLTLVYGYRVWRLSTTLATLSLVCAATALALGWAILQGPVDRAELTEVPLMGAMFLAMVWHAERRQAALREVGRAAEREHEFVRDASHQLKTPITIARGFAELLRGATLAPSAHEDLDVLLAELDRLSDLTGGLVMLAATEELDSLVLTRFDLGDVMTSTSRRWRGSTDRRWQFASEAAGVLEADRVRVESALDELIENAVKATDVGDRIRVTARAEGNVVVFEVVDTGIGVADHLLPRVFDRFWTVQADNGRDRRGTGLGLAIVKAIAEAHGGSISARSRMGSGTTFVLRLPRFKPDGSSWRELRGIPAVDDEPTHNAVPA